MESSKVREIGLKDRIDFAEDVLRVYGITDEQLLRICYKSDSAKNHLYRLYDTPYGSVTPTSLLVREITAAEATLRDRGVSEEELQKLRDQHSYGLDYVDMLHELS